MPTSNTLGGLSSMCLSGALWHPACLNFMVITVLATEDNSCSHLQKVWPPWPQTAVLWGASQRANFSHQFTSFSSTVHVIYNVQTRAIPQVVSGGLNILLHILQCAVCIEKCRCHAGYAMRPSALLSSAREHRLDAMVSR
jgi:hypothetical protein